MPTDSGVRLPGAELQLHHSLSFLNLHATAQSTELLTCDTGMTGPPPGLL